MRSMPLRFAVDKRYVLVADSKYNLGRYVSTPGTWNGSIQMTGLFGKPTSTLAEGNLGPIKIRIVLLHRDPYTYQNGASTDAKASVVGNGSFRPITWDHTSIRFQCPNRAPTESIFTSENSCKYYLNPSFLRQFPDSILTDSPNPTVAFSMYTLNPSW